MAEWRGGVGAPTQPTKPDKNQLIISNHITVMLRQGFDYLKIHVYWKVIYLSHWNISHFIWCRDRSVLSKLTREENSVVEMSREEPLFV